jgi:hypothetical protein
MGLSLLAYSDERVSMINAQGSVVFEQPITGSGRSLVEMFKDSEGTYSCFVRGDNVIVYRGTKQAAEFKIDEALALELPAEYSNVFEPLELIYSEGQLLLTAKIGTNAENQSMISVFELDFKNNKSE